MSDKVREEKDNVVVFRTMDQMVEDEDAEDRRLRESQASDAVAEFNDDLREGNVDGFILVAVMKNGDIMTNANFQSRLELMGALEYAKTYLGT